MKEMQLIEEEHEVLKDVGRDPEAKVVENLICYELDEPSLNHFFLIDANLKERERIELIQFLKKVPWTLGNTMRDQGESRANYSDQQPRQPKNCEGGPETDRDGSNT